MKFTIKTIGCKVNTYESNKLRDIMIKAGFEYIDVANRERYSELDYYIVNTCSVTSIADKKSRQMLHIAKKYNDKVVVIAVGCLVNAINSKTSDSGKSDELIGAENSSIIEEYKVRKEMSHLLGYVDYALPNEKKDELPDLLIQLSSEHFNDKLDKKCDSAEKDEVPTESNCKTAYSANKLLGKAIRSFIKIQDGCDEYCTYCLIPYLRGHIKSRPEEEIIDEIYDKICSGVKEVVLTGIHLSSYGLDRVNMTYEKEGAIDIARNNLLDLINKISHIQINDDKTKRLERIRFGSLEPRIINEDFLKGLIENDAIRDKFCPNFCLSLQSGSDKILKRMNRHYTTSEYENACKIIRKYIKNVTITTDVIVGFPGETEKDYMDSLSFVKKMRFYNPNIFPYSERKGTLAAKFDEKIPHSIKHERTLKMIEECDKITKEIEKEFEKKNTLGVINRTRDAIITVGSIVEDVLIEKIVSENGKKCGIGYTKEYIRRKVCI